MGNYTTLMFVSSLLNYISSGFSWAAFIPSILRGYAWADQELDPVFLIVWLIADVLNFVALMMSDVDLPQKMLGGWYLLADLIMLGQWGWYGSNHVIHIRKWRAPANEKMRSERVGVARAMTDRWESFSSTDNLKLCCFTVSLGIALFGIMTIVNLYNDPSYSIEVPTEVDVKIEVMSFAAFGMFTGARVVTLAKGWRAHTRGNEPAESKFSFLYVIMFAENAFQLASILLLSPGNLDYYKYEAPWIFGSAAPMVSDIIVISSAMVWHRKWEQSDRGKAEAKLEAQEKKVEARLANMIHLAQQNARYQKLLDEHRHADDPEKASAAGKKPSARQARRDKRKLDNRRSQIGRYKEVLINSRQQRHERTARAGPEEGQERERHHGSIHTFAKKVGRPYEQGYVEKEEQMSTEPGTTDEESGREQRALRSAHDERVRRGSTLRNRSHSRTRASAPPAHDNDLDSLNSAAPSLD